LLAVDLFTGLLIFTVTVKKPLTVNIPVGSEWNIARRVLDEWPQFQLRESIHPKVDIYADHYPLVIEVKRSVGGAAHAWQIIHQMSPVPEAVLVVAEQIGESARRVLRDNGINYIDGAGNAHIEFPRFYLHVEGKAPAPLKYPARLRGKAATIAQALLLYPERDWTIKKAADEAHVSPSLTHRILERLESEGFISSRGRGPMKSRHLVNAQGLLDALASETEAPRDSQAFYRLARDGAEAATLTRQMLTKAGVRCVVTGSAAASKLAPNITAIPVGELWVTEQASLSRAANLGGLKPTDQGANVVLMQSAGDTAFAFADERRGLANWVRIYLDLLAVPRRGEEQAALLRSRMLR
jgi:hypothetical protein